MYAVTADILASTASRNDTIRGTPHSFLALPPRGYVVIVKGMARPISERKSSLWRCAKVVRKEVLVFRGLDELVNQASRLIGELGLTTRLGDSSARNAYRDHSFDVQITGMLQKLTS